MNDHRPRAVQGSYKAAAPAAVKAARRRVPGARRRARGAGRRLAAATAWSMLRFPSYEQPPRRSTTARTTRDGARSRARHDRVLQHGAASKASDAHRPKTRERSSMSAIVDIVGREILDSRGNPTVECDVLLESRHHGPRRGAVAARPPARAKRSSCATATRRATSARACCKAVEHINTEICEAVLGPRRVASRPSSTGR